MMVRGVAAAAALVPALLGGLAGCDIPDHARGSDSLIAIVQGPTPLEAAEMAIDRYNADNRTRGTMLLANAYFGGEDPYYALYLEHVDDNDPNVRAAAVRGLALHGRPEDAAVVIERLGDPNNQVRLEAARALQRIHNPAAIDPLIVASRSPVLPTPPTETSPGSPGMPGENEPTIRAEAARALGQYGESRVLLPLISALDDRFLAVNFAALGSLRTLTGIDLGIDRKAWLEWYGQTETPFAGRTEYIYPVFERDRFFWEYLPFVPGPPNETPGTPAGFPPTVGGASPGADDGRG